MTSGSPNAHFGIGGTPASWAALQEWCCFLRFVTRTFSLVWASPNPVDVADLLEDFSIDGTSIDDGFTDGGIWYQASVRRQHMTVKDASFSLLAARRPWAPQLPATFDRATSDRLLVLTRISNLCLDPGPTRGSPGSIENYISGPWHSVLCKHLQSFFKKKTSLASFTWLTFVFAPSSSCIRFELHLEVKLMCAELVQSKSRFRRIPRNGKSSLTIMSLHCHDAVVRNKTQQCNMCIACSPNCAGTRRRRKWLQGLQCCTM